MQATHHHIYAAILRAYFCKTASSIRLLIYLYFTQCYFCASALRQILDVGFMSYPVLCGAVVPYTGHAG